MPRYAHHLGLADGEPAADDAAVRISLLFGPPRLLSGKFHQPVSSYREGPSTSISSKHLSLLGGTEMHRLVYRDDGHPPVAALCAEERTTLSHIESSAWPEPARSLTM